nr:DUF3000 domain-containing protein [Pseudoclavibacter endophyticus]
MSLHVPPGAFEAAADSVRGATYRSEVRVHEIRSPAGLAPNSIAFAGDVDPMADEGDSEVGTGRFILLHDPDEPDAWHSDFRVVTFAQAPLEPEIGVDPFVSEVAWAWLVDALAARGADYTHASGTATIINSRGFGELESQGVGAQIEIRASWTPRDTAFAAHAEAWGDLLCLLAGLPPVETDDVAVLRPRRGPRGS